MDWSQIISLIIGVVSGGSLSTLITIRLYKRLKKGEVEKLEYEVRKMQDGENRERIAGLIQDLSNANDIIREISAKLQVYIANEVKKDIEIANLKAENERLLDERKNKLCAKCLTCLEFERDENNN